MIQLVLGSLYHLGGKCFQEHFEEHGGFSENFKTGIYSTFLWIFSPA